jgi:hypothetical protein
VTPGLAPITKTEDRIEPEPPTVSALRSAASLIPTWHNYRRRTCTTLIAATQPTEAPSGRLAMPAARAFELR